MCECTSVVRVKLACLWGKPQKRVFLDVSEDVLMSFYVVGVTLGDIWRVSGGMCVHDRREIKVAMPTCQKMCSCRFAWQACHFVTFDVFQEECVCTTVVRLKLPCRWEKPRNVSFSTCQKMCSSRFAWQDVALCDI